MSLHKQLQKARREIAHYTNWELAMERWASGAQETYNKDVLDFLQNTTIIKGKKRSISARYLGPGNGFDNVVITVPE